MLFWVRKLSDLTDITPTFSCSEYQCLVSKKSCIIVLISKNPSEGHRDETTS